MSLTLPAAVWTLHLTRAVVQVPFFSTAGTAAIIHRFPFSLSTNRLHPVRRFPSIACPSC